jgi:hypothetical protein
LEIEAAQLAGDIDYFADEVETRHLTSRSFGKADLAADKR